MPAGQAFGFHEKGTAPTNTTGVVTLNNCSCGCLWALPFPHENQSMTAGVWPIGTSASGAGRGHRSVS